MEQTNKPSKQTNKQTKQTNKKDELGSTPTWHTPVPVRILRPKESIVQVSSRIRGQSCAVEVSYRSEIGCAKTNPGAGVELRVTKQIQKKKKKKKST
jgi:hypothetical protein